MSSPSSGTTLLKCDVLMVNLMGMFLCRQHFTWKVWMYPFMR